MTEWATFCRKRLPNSRTGENRQFHPAWFAGTKRRRFGRLCYPILILNREAVLKDGGNLAWAMRKNSPQLKALLDAFFKTHREGTAFGTIMAQRFLTVRAVKRSTSLQPWRLVLEIEGLPSQIGHHGPRRHEERIPAKNPNLNPDFEYYALLL